MNNDLDKNHSTLIDEAIQAAYEDIRKIEQSQQHIDTPEALEQLECSVREVTNELSTLILQKHLQASLDSPANKDKENELVKTCQGKYKNEGFIVVSLDTMTGISIEVQARYYRRSCDRHSGKRHKGIYAGLILLGIHERCTPLLASNVSKYVGFPTKFLC